MAEINNAIILAGGGGTRMLPASLFAPKETLPLIDTPIINHLIWEVARAGVSHVHLVLSQRKKDILDEFLDNGIVHGKEVRADLPRDSLRLGLEEMKITPHIQENPGGVADAISTAIGRIDGPFLVLLGDMLLMDKHVGPKHSGPEFASSASSSLVSKYEDTGLPNVGIFPVESNEISKYGVVGLSDGMVVEIVEKPSLEEAPSEYVLCGRYVMPENTKEILEQYPISEFGEMQSIRLLNHLVEDGGLQAVKLDGMKMYDSGDPMAWLKSQIDHGLNRSDIGGNLENWLRERLQS
jgi:UTP--glucose-1-phosphate uridylyltransferase